MSTPQSTPAGWYPDPAGSVNQRYWDGTQWTEHLAQPGPAAGAAIVQPDLPADARINTPFIWIAVLIPLVSILNISLFNFQAYMQRSISSPATAGFSQFSDPGYLLLQFIGLLFYAANVVLSFFDWRALKRVGIIRPFHWAWSFLNPVYIIGRTVVLRRRVHRGMAPLWVYIVVYVVTTVVVTAIVISAVVAILPELSSISHVDLVIHSVGLERQA